MSAIRRIYVYIVTFAALATLAFGVANLARALLDAWVNTSSGASPAYLQDQVAFWGAAALVGLPVWAVHWLWAQRLCQDAGERSSPLRRLFLYLVLAGAALVGVDALTEVVSGVVAALIGAPVAGARAAAPPLPVLLVAAAVWTGYWRVVRGDRSAVGETGASATLRRWYLHGVSMLALLFVLTGAQLAFFATWLIIMSAESGYALRVPGLTLVIGGLLLYWLHWVWIPRRLNPTDRALDGRSTLRSVYLFLGLTVVLLGTLSGISQALYYALARVLGVSEPGGVGGSLLEAAGGPLSVTIVYGAGWLYQARAIDRSGQQLEAPRQVGVRRLYEHVTSFVALLVLAVGVTGLLWMLGDVIARVPDTVGAVWWRDRLSLFATLAIVGLPVWLLHWRPPQQEGPRSLTRRVYLYVSLIGAVLALLGSGAAAVYRVIGLLLGSVTPSSASAELSHALAVALVATGVAAYHWRMVRIDTLQRTAMAGESKPAHLVVELGAPTAAALDAALESLRERGVSVRRRMSEHAASG